MDYIFGHDKDRMDDYYRTMGGWKLVCSKKVH